MVVKQETLKGFSAEETAFRLLPALFLHVVLTEDLAKKHPQLPRHGLNTVLP